MKRWLGVVALLILTGGVLWSQAGTDRRSVPHDLRGVMTNRPVKLAPLQLTDQHGLSVTESWFNGQWTLVAFGFTHCPDVCLATLAQFGVIKQALTQGYPAIAQPRYVFVSVDPERDTPQQLAAFLSSFDQSFIGLTGATAQIEALEQSTATFHRKQTASASGDYQVSHSGEIFLIDPAGQVVARFVPPLEPAVVASQLSSIMTFYARNSVQVPAAST